MLATYRLTGKKLMICCIQWLCKRRNECSNFHAGHLERTVSPCRTDVRCPTSEDHMNGDRMFELAQALAVTKSRQDVPAALKLLHKDMVLESPAFGTNARGLAENEKALTRFFTSFPDYKIVLDGHADNGDTLICWGTVRMTMTGDRFGVAPIGARAEVLVV